MNILVVSQFYYPEPFRIHEICEELVRRRNNVTVLTTIPNYPDGDFYKGYDNKDYVEMINGVKVIRAKSRPRLKGSINLVLNYVSAYINIKRRLKNLKPDFDVVYAYQLSPISSSWPALTYAKKHNLPSLLYCLDIWPDSIINVIHDNNPIFKCVKLLSKKIYKQANLLSVSSPSFTDYIGNLIGIAPNNINVNFQHAKDIGLQPKAVDDNCVNFMFMGNIGDSQFIEGLLMAVDRIKISDGFKIHIVGSGSDLDRVMNMAKELKLSDKVLFYGRQSKDKMPEYYKMADVCIVSLRHEGVVGWTIPGKVQEYMSAGKAILGCIDGDTKVIIDDAKCGLCCEAENIDLYVENIRKLINMSKEEHHQYGLNARAYYEQHFSLEKHVDTLDFELKKLVSK